MTAYLRYQATELPKAVGQDQADGSRESDGRAGHLCYGPYVALAPGRYTAGFGLRRRAPAPGVCLEMEVCAERGRRALTKRTVFVDDLFSDLPGFTHIDFEINELASDCELRLFVPTQTRVVVSEAVLFRRDLSAWGSR